MNSINCLQKLRLRNEVFASGFHIGQCFSFNPNKAHGYSSTASQIDFNRCTSILVLTIQMSTYIDT